jgi:hypothetical protein
MNRHILDFAFTEIPPSNSAHANTSCTMANGKLGRPLLHQDRKNTIQKVNAEY